LGTAEFSRSETLSPPKLFHPIEENREQPDRQDRNDIPEDEAGYERQWRNGIPDVDLCAQGISRK
jgi:hypothetical protein